MAKNRTGFSIIELMIVVAVIGLLTAILIPAVMNYHQYARQKSCIGNLRQIDQAIQQWAADSKALSTDVVTHSNIMPYLRISPVCPSPSPGGGTFVKDYGMTFVEEDPFCVANNGLKGSPHVFISNQKTAIHTPSVDSKTSETVPSD